MKIRTLAVRNLFSLITSLAIIGISNVQSKTLTESDLPDYAKDGIYASSDLSWKNLNWGAKFLDVYLTPNPEIPIISGNINGGGLDIVMVSSMNTIDNKGTGNKERNLTLSNFKTLTVTVPESSYQAEASYAKKYGFNSQTHIAVKNFNLSDCGDVVFKNLPVDVIDVSDGECNLSADNGDISFLNNRGVYDFTQDDEFDEDEDIWVTKWGFGNASAIALDNSNLKLGAKEGKSIKFFGVLSSYSNISFRPDDSEFEVINENHLIDLNSEKEQTGTILISGANRVRSEVFSENGFTFTDEEKVAYNKFIDFSGTFSNIIGNTTLHRGTLILEKGVTLGNLGTTYEDQLGTKLFKSSFEAKPGSCLQMTDSWLVVHDVKFDSATIRANNATIVANSVNFSGTTTFDLSLASGDKPVLLITTQHIKINELNDSLQIIDENFNIPYQNGTVSIDGELKIISASGNTAMSRASQATGHAFALIGYTNEISIDSEHKDFSKVSVSNNNGQSFEEVSLQEDGSFMSGNGTRYSLITNVGDTPVYNPSEEGNGDGDIPELDDDLGYTSDSTLDTLWTSASNMKSLVLNSNSQITHQRFESEKKSNVWISGLGDFASYNSKGDFDGFDYSGGGYSVGYDQSFGDKYLLGLAFGQMIGQQKTDIYNDKFDQNTLMFNIYAAKEWAMRDTSSLIISGSLGMGFTNNDWKVDGEKLGSWDNQAVMATLMATWREKLNESWALLPIFGLEFTNAVQKSFNDEDFFREDGKMNNLSLNIGIGLEHVMKLSHNNFWVNALSISYVPDVHRDNPHARESYNDGIWSDSYECKGMSIARNAGRINYNTQYIFSQNWSLYANYGLDFRGDALSQQVSTGVKFSF